MSRLSEEKSKISNEPKIYNYYNKPEQVEEVKYVGAYFKRKQPTVQTKQESSMFYHQPEPKKTVNMQVEFEKLKVETDDYEFDPKISSLFDEEHIDETSFYDDCVFEPEISSLSDEEHIDIVHDINLTEQKVIDTVQNYILQSVEANDCNTYAETAKTVKNCLVEVGLIPQSASLNSIMAAEEVHYQNMATVKDLLQTAMKPIRRMNATSGDIEREEVKNVVQENNENGKKKQRVDDGNKVAKKNNQAAKKAMKNKRKPIRRMNATSGDIENAKKVKKHKMQKMVHDEAIKKRKKAEEAKKNAEELEEEAKKAEAVHKTAHEAHALKLLEMLGREGIEEAKLTLASELVDEDGKSTMSDIQFASICLENGIGVDE